tara:strand:+ start:6002 stop:7216 length:1215 start_codon:yes stop_codon:yes gene_type:complete
MLSKTKLFLVGYFLPAWISALMMWGDDRTSSSFSAAPYWFVYFKYSIQILAILLLFLPIKVRSRPSLLGAFLAIATALSLKFFEPILEAEFIIVNSSIQICVIALFLCFAQPSARLEKSDVGFLFSMFLVGFILQIALFLGFGREPSHTLTDVFVRFNGITNDSLATGLIIGALAPWAVKSRYAELKVMAIVGMAILSGSLFAVVFVPAAIIGYLIYNRLYRFAAFILAGIAAIVITFYDLFIEIAQIKVQSIIVHLRYFLNLGGLDYKQSTKGCSEEFCESFVELGLHLSPVYLLLFYGLLLYFLIQFVMRFRPTAGQQVPYDTLRVFGAAILVASLVHPVPLIPFAIPIFFVFSSLYRAGAAGSARVGPGRARPGGRRALSTRRPPPRMRPLGVGPGSTRWR